MKKFLLMGLMLAAVLSMVQLGYAFEVKYGGYFQARYHSTDNQVYGTSNDAVPGRDLNDNQNYFDQRLRFYITYVSSENLKVVTKYEEDTLWGWESSGAARSGGGDVGADAVNIEMKNVYADFAIPSTPLRFKVGVQGVNDLLNWIVSDDFSGITAEAKLDAFTIAAGYLAARNINATSTEGNIDDWYLTLTYKGGPFKVTGQVFYQDGHNTSVGLNAGGIDNPDGFHGNNSDLISNRNFGSTDALFGEPYNGRIENNNLIDLGLGVEFKMAPFAAYLNFVKNFGGFDDPTHSLGVGADTDYRGYMIEAGGTYFCGPLTFSLGGFMASGAKLNDNATGTTHNLSQWSHDLSSAFHMPAGVAHSWSEIMGRGLLDESVGNISPGYGAVGYSDVITTQAGYSSGDSPSNMWTISAGAAWQVLEGTKLTFNYYYIGTIEDVIADDVTNPAHYGMSSSIGHEFDFYLNQKIVDNLNITFVAAYMIANDGYTRFPNDQDPYKLGAKLLWAF